VAQPIEHSPVCRSRLLPNNRRLGKNLRQPLRQNELALLIGDRDEVVRRLLANIARSKATEARQDGPFGSIDHYCADSLMQVCANAFRGSGNHKYYAATGA